MNILKENFFFSKKLLLPFVCQLRRLVFNQSSPFHPASKRSKHTTKLQVVEGIWVFFINDQVNLSLHVPWHLWPDHYWLWGNVSQTGSCWPPGIPDLASLGLSSSIRSPWSSHPVILSLSFLSPGTCRIHLDRDSQEGLGWPDSLSGLC